MQKLSGYQIKVISVFYISVSDVKYLRECPEPQWFLMSHFILFFFEITKNFCHPGVGVGVHQGSVLSPLLFIIVFEALSREFRTGCPWELLYADDLMISAESMEELLVKVQTWKTEMEKKGLRVNMGKTKIMESGINLDVRKKSGKYPVVSVSQELVALMQSSVVAASAGCIRNAVALRDPCALTLCSGAPDALGLLGLLMKEKFQRLRLQTKSLNLSQNSAATLGTCCLQEVAARWLRAGCDHTLQMCMGQVPPIVSPSHQPPSAPSDQR